MDSLGEENMTDDAVLSSLGASLCSAFEKESVRLVGSVWLFFELLQPK